MKKLSYFVVGLLLFSGFAAIGIGNEADEKLETVSLSFLEPNIIEKESFLEIEVEGSNNRIFSAGKPMLPVYTETLILPFGAKVNDVLCEVENVESRVLTGKVLPAPEPQIENLVEISTESKVDESIYNSDELFPDNWFSYNVGVGLDKYMEHKTLVTINAYPVRYSPGADTVYYAENIDLKVTYEEPNGDPFPANSAYELVIIAPEEFSSDLQNLVDHKISFGISTILKTTEEIYDEYDYRDAPEEIKYFIKDALEDWNTKYVLLVGGLKSLIWAEPKEDINYGVKDWRLPVRYTNLKQYEPGLLCDLYYADIYKEGGVFDDWDSDGDGKFAEFGAFADKLDLYPDVALGRLACRNTNEVKSVVDKIINYETNTYSSDWFKKMTLVSGDGFLDQEDLDFQWDTNGLPDGEYTIYAQSTNPEMVSGPIDEIPITLDRTKETSLTFNHDDHLTTNLQYPFDPVAEIVSVSDGDILGNSDYTYNPSEAEAYCNDFTHWAKVEYKNGILHIRGKSYDPKPYGNVTDIKVWIKNSNNDIVFEDERIGTEMYWEGEWTTGEVLLHDRAGAPYYMPNDFQHEFLWSSDGSLTGQQDVINALSKGSGFTFFSGHGSPAVWMNHYPGIPGNRQNGDVRGLSVIDIFGGPPFLPMEKLSNDYKNPVVVVGGCHNSMCSVTLLTTLLDKDNSKNTHCYGNPTAECWSWWLTRLSKRGAIACMGNTGYGFGILGEWCTTGGVDNWITTEFFKQYGTEGLDILGEAYAHALSSYIENIGTNDAGDMQTVQCWILYGDPSLKMGGYPPQGDLRISNDDGNSYPGDSIQLEASAYEKPNKYVWDLDNDGEYDDATGEEVTKQWTDPGVYWVSVKAIYDDKEATALTIVDILNKQPNKASIDGPTDLNIGQTYTYTVEGTDPDGDELYYLVEWGDDTYNIITPDDQNTVTHKWSKTGSFNIKVLAIDSYAEWAEEALTITISKDKHGLHSMPLLQFINNMLEKFPNLLPLLRQIIGLVN